MAGVAQPVVRASGGPGDTERLLIGEGSRSKAGQPLAAVHELPVTQLLGLARIELARQRDPAQFPYGATPFGCAVLIEAYRHGLGPSEVLHLQRAHARCPNANGNLRDATT